MVQPPQVRRRRRRRKEGRADTGTRRSCQAVHELATTLAPTASELLGCQRLRLYQDCVFLKRPGDGALQLALLAACCMC